VPHCVIECPAELNILVDFDRLVKAIHDTTEASGLFVIGDVKSRLVLSEHYWVNGQRDMYVHVVCHILSGRTVEQRKALGDALALTLCELLPTVEMLSVEVREIERKIYSNRQAVGKVLEVT
jgi:5-carboxymethyl-2-hydroxymuconate isomerase